MMNINFTPFTILWALLAAVVLALIAYRKTVSMKEDETLHLGPGGENVPMEQAAIAHKLEVIDKWGRLLTVVAVVYGLVLASIYTWQTWLSSGTGTGL
jgi:hypothetical protein